MRDSAKKRCDNCDDVCQGIKDFFFHFEDMREVIKEHYAGPGIMEKLFGIKINVRGAGWREHNVAKNNHPEAWASFFDDFFNKLRMRLLARNSFCSATRGQCYFCQRLRSEPDQEDVQEEEEDKEIELGECASGVLPDMPSWQQPVTAFLTAVSS